MQIAGDANVVEDRQRPEQADVLERARDAERHDVVHPQPGDIASGETHGAFSGLVDAGDQIEDGGLPGAIRTDEPAEFALMDGEVHCVDGGEPAEADRDLIKLEQGGHGALEPTEEATTDHH